MPRFDAFSSRFGFLEQRTDVGNIMQTYLEDSNVNAVTEISDLIAAQRAYEMNARVVTGADEMLQTTSQMK